MTIDVIMSLDAPIVKFDSEELEIVAKRIVSARKIGAPVILSMGAHVLRRGNSNFINALIRDGIFTHIGVNGACAIHDYEFARIGATTESVARLGEAIGKAIAESDFHNKHSSVFACAYQYHVPLTVHVGIGQDIIHEHPNFDGSAYGEASYRDFLIFVQSMLSLEGGVFLNYGTDVMGPEVYLKALSMVRNVAHQQGRKISRFTTAVFDLLDLGGDYRQEIPKMCSNYYFRPFKTILVRTIKEGGESYYIQGDHRATLPNLYKMILDQKGRS